MEHSVKLPLLCRWWGHNFDPVAHEHGIGYCMRCEQYPPESETGLRVWLRTVRWRLIVRMNHLRYDARRWWRCADCGGRLGRHNDQCIPF